MNDRNVALSVKNLAVQYYTDDGRINAVNGVSFDLMEGERLGLVGESGCGKSTMALGLMRMIKPPGKILSGETWIDGVDLNSLNYEDMRMARALKLGMIPQGAMNSLVPVLRVKNQIIDTLKDHKLPMSKEQMLERAYEALESVGLPRKVAEMYPHELSGGMKQRVCAAIGLAMKPKVIVADEPTSALDVITQRQVMETIGKLQEQTKASIIMITHDMGLMAQFVDRVAVMYAGKLAEVSSVKDAFTNPLHPYTKLLINTLPVLSRKGVFVSIPGMAPSFLELPPGCPFHPRCPRVMDICTGEIPEQIRTSDGRLVSCHLYHSEG
jgi:peptide/nickel transport system ATP-binding protein